MEGPVDPFPRSTRSVEQEAMILGPELDVSRHRLVVQSYVGGQVAEEDMDQFLRDFREQHLVVVAMHADPAVRPFVRFPKGPMMLPVRVDIPGSVKPARLGNAQRMGTAVARDQMQQGNLQGHGKLALQPDIGFHSPEEKAAREGQQMEFSRAVCAADGSGKNVERTKREQVVDRPGRLIPIP